MKSTRIIFDLWIWKMAWRDSRHHRKKLFLFSSSIILGIAALVAISSLGRNLEKSIDGQAKTLLGADLLIHSLGPFPQEIEALFDSIGVEQSREITFNSMVLFPKTGATRLVQVRASDNRLPFYGELGTLPVNAAKSFRDNKEALVDEGLMVLSNAKVGDSVKVGNLTFKIAGRLIKIPSQPPINALFTAPVYIPLSYVQRTNLIQPGSLIRYRNYFKFADDFDVENLLKKIKPRLNAALMSFATVQSRKDRLGDIMKNLYRFLNLVGFIALLLGSVGVASSIHVYVKQKLDIIAVLRCLGAEGKQTFAIYLIQAVVMGVGGAAMGALIGSGIQVFLPEVLGEFLPIDVSFSISWPAIINGMIIGSGMALLFALIPLISIRRTSPLLALRSSYENSHSTHKDPLRWVIYFLIVLTVTLFSVYQSENWIFGAGFSFGIGIAFLLLVLVAQLLMKMVKKYSPVRWSYPWRQGLANLYRPNNQTLIMILSLGLGTFLISTLYLTHSTLLRQVYLVDRGGRPNMVLFDIQPDQKDELESLIRSYDLPILQNVPVVTMRLSSIKGSPVEEILSDTTWSGSKNLLRWEYRTSYRDTLIDSEEIVAGDWIGEIDITTEIIPISIEEGTAKRIQVALGDTLVFNVQGVPISTFISSIRKVDWQRIQTNFMVLFPNGALEYAPQFYILVTKTPSTELSAKFQQLVVQKLPNISVIDLSLVLQTIDSLLGKISFVIRFMAFFSILTGLTILVSAVITSRYQRIQEIVLLKTIGAQYRQLVAISVFEYLFLGGFAAITGLILSVIGSWALARFVFDMTFSTPLIHILIIFLLVTGLPIFLGMVNSRGIHNKPPLEVLRAET